MNRFLILIILLLILASSLTGCAKKPPPGAIYAAMLFCPIDECSDWKLGSTSKQLPYSNPSYYDRWCVDLEFTRNGKSQRIVVDTYLLDPEDKGNLGWSALNPIYNADCSIFEK
jgi:hypothetical protein